MSDEIAALIAGLTTYDPDHRMSAQDFFNAVESLPYPHPPRRSWGFRWVHQPAAG